MRALPGRAIVHTVPAHATPATNPVLALSGVSCRFGQALAVEDVSLTVQAGTITGLIGPNGAGKTTLFNLIAGSLPPSAGRIEIDGCDIAGEPAWRRLRRGIGRTFQIPRPFPAMTVLENVMVCAQAQLGERPLTNWLRPGAVARQERAIAERACAVIEFVSLGRLANERAAKLSGGQRKLLELARVLMAGPRLVLLDEPAAGVNPTLLETIAGHIRTLHGRGLTFLIVEHNMDFIGRLCSRLHVMAAGRLLGSGTPDEVLADPRVKQAYLG